MAANPALRTYVQDRLAGAVVAPGGTAAPWASRALEGAAARATAEPALGLAWSPQQIAQRLRLDYPDDATMRISHEAVYQALYVQGRGVLRRELTACLRTGRALRVPRARTRSRGKSFVTPEILISQRPAEAEDRAVPGLAETIHGLYKAEVIHRRGPWRSFEAVEFATLEWVAWFNTRRLLEPIGNVPPAEAEARYYAQAEEPAMAA